MIIVGQERKNVAQSRKCNCSAVLQMRERVLCAIAGLCKQDDDKAGAVLLNGYEK